jgi:hypothetical protein
MLYSLLFTACAVAGLPKTPHHPEVPSIPLLGARERAAVANLINLAILDDLGKPVPNAPAVRDAFKKLGPEAIPQLLEAFNHVCNQGWTCPANIIGNQLARFVHKQPGDLDLLSFVQKQLGRGVQNPSPPSAFKDMQVGLAMQLKRIHAELKEELKRLDFEGLVSRAGKVQFTKYAEWCAVAGEMGKRSDTKEAFDFLVNTLENAPKPGQREAAHHALVAWSGVNRDPPSFTSQGQLWNAASNWRAWYKSKK